MISRIQKLEECLRDELYVDVEIQCKAFLLGVDAKEIDSLTLVSFYQCLARALEAQGKLSEAYLVRKQAKLLLKDFESGIMIVDFVRTEPVEHSQPAQ